MISIFILFLIYSFTIQIYNLISLTTLYIIIIPSPDNQNTSKYPARNRQIYAELEIFKQLFSKTVIIATFAVYISAPVLKNIFILS